MSICEVKQNVFNSNSGSPYDGGFFDSIEAGSVSSARAIVPLVKELLPFRTVVDIGCGRGAWLSVFKEHGAESVCGYDGEYINRSKLIIPQECYIAIDLSKPFSVTGRYDLAVCLEVGEHLPRTMAFPLVKALVKLAPAVLFSAAIPGQGGTHHINEQWPDYWQALFDRFDFVCLDSIRHVVSRDSRVKWWFKQNMFLYVQRGIVQRDERLLEEYERTLRIDVDIVAKQKMSAYRSVSGLVSELVRAVRQTITRRAGY